MRCFRQKHLNLIKYKSHQPQNCDFQCNITLGQWLFLLFGLVTHHSIRLARMSHTPNLPCSLDFLITVSGTFLTVRWAETNGGAVEGSTRLFPRVLRQNNLSPDVHTCFYFGLTLACLPELSESQRPHR